MNKKIYDKIMSGNSDNKMFLSMNFVERIKGDHFVYKHNDIPEGIVIQPLGNKAKAYQVKQIRNLFNKYGL